MKTLDRLNKEKIINYKHGRDFSAIDDLLRDNGYSATFYDGKIINSLTCYERGNSRIDVTADWKVIDKDRRQAHKVYKIELVR